LFSLFFNLPVSTRDLPSGVLSSRRQVKVVATISLAKGPFPPMVWFFLFFLVEFLRGSFTSQNFPWSHFVGVQFLLLGTLAVFHSGFISAKAFAFLSPEFWGYTPPPRVCIRCFVWMPGPLPCFVLVINFPFRIVFYPFSVAIGWGAGFGGKRVPQWRPGI